MSERAKSVAIRALKTFWQSALASVVVAMPQIADSIGSGWEVLKPVLVSAFVGALAAGFSAAYNGVIKPLVNKKR